MAIVLTDEQVESLLDMQTCLEALEPSYKALASGMAINRPRTDIHAMTHQSNQIYRFKSMEGILQDEGVLALRIQSDIAAWPIIHGMRRQVKVPAAPGGRFAALIFLFAIEDGKLLALMHDSFLQRMRVGGTSGLGAKYLARPDSRRMALLGAGWQAGAQLQAFSQVLPIEEVNVYSPTREHCVAFASEMEEMLHITVRPVSDAEEAVQGVDFIASATSSMQPVLKADWIRPGMHVSAIKRFEIEDRVWSVCQRIVVNSKEGKGRDYATATVSGADVPYLEGEGMNYRLDEFPDLPQVISGEEPGRESAEETTFFNNNIGLGTQFAAVAFRVYQKAIVQGIGDTINDDWLYQKRHS